MQQSWLNHTSVAFVLLAIAVLSVCATPTLSDEVVNDSLVVFVRDAKTNAPLAGAVVYVRGPIDVADRTDRNGKITFSDLQDGTYSVTTTLAGYRTVAYSFESRHDAKVIIDVRLARTNELHVISTVVSRAVRPGAEYDLDRSNTAGVVSWSLSDALANVSGLELSNSHEFNGATEASLLGHEPYQTAVSMNGVPLNVPGTAFNFSALDLDLIRGLSVNYGPSAGAEGGSLALSLFEPTVPWQTLAEGSVANFNRSSLMFAEQGTTGRLGISVREAFRADADPLGESTFEDASGYDYNHAGTDDIRGTAASVLYRIGTSNVLSASDISSSSSRDVLCTTFTNNLPCGYGPGNSESDIFHLFSLADTLAVGTSTLTATAYRYSTSTFLNLLNQTIAKAPYPLQESGFSSSQGYSLSGVVPLGLSDTVSALINQNVIESSSNTSALGTYSTDNYLRHDVSASLTERHKIGRKADILLDLQNTSLTSTPGALFVEGSLLMRHSQTEESVLSAFVGRGINPISNDTLISQPWELTYDCAARAAFGAAPGSSGGTNGTDGINAAWTQQLSRGNVSMQALVQQEYGAPVTAYVSAAAFPPGLFYASYFTDAQTYYRLPVNCGGAELLSPRSIYLSTAVSDAHLFFGSLRAQFEIPLSATVALSGNAALDRTAAWSGDTLLQDPHTIFRQGSQLPGVPMIGAFVGLAYKPAIITAPSMFGGIRYFGSGNSSFLPPNVVADLAVVQHLERGQLAIVIDNVFDTYAGTFATSRNAVPFARVNGTELAGLSYPHQPRLISASFSFGIGRDISLESPELRGIANATEQTLQPGFLIVKWPTTKPADPFRHNSGSACMSQEAALADPILDALQKNVDQINAVGGKGAYPNSWADWKGFPDAIQGQYIALPGGYAVALSTTKYSIFKALIACGFIHLGYSINAQAANVPYPQRHSGTTETVYYSPAVGVYFIEVPWDTGVAQKFRFYPLPSMPPPNPFALLNGRTCDSELRPLADRLLQQLQGFFSNPHPKSGRTADWTITAHGSTTSTWYEMYSDEIGTVAALKSCAHVSAGSPDAVRALGFGAVSVPYFGYTPRLGLYVIGN
jgi:hypothetical protein